MAEAGRPPLQVGLTVDWMSVDPVERGAWGRWKFAVNATYSRLVCSAGACPVALLPCGRRAMAAMLENIDLLIMTGGNDPDPSLYGRSEEGCGTIDYHRPRWEKSLYNAAREMGLPVLGICLGLQTIAIAEGAALIRDIPSIAGRRLSIDHQGSAASPRFHEIDVEPGTLPGGLFDSRITVSSFHHQAVESIPAGFRLAASSEDGIIEAVESLDGEVLGVQWHPERDWTGPRLLGAMLRRAEALR